MEIVESSTRAATQRFTVTSLVRQAKREDWRTEEELIPPTCDPGSNNAASLLPPTLTIEPPHFFRLSVASIFILKLLSSTGTYTYTHTHTHTRTLESLTKLAFYKHFICTLWHLGAHLFTGQQKVRDMTSNTSTGYFFLSVYLGILTPFGVLSLSVDQLWGRHGGSLGHVIHSWPWASHMNAPSHTRATGVHSNTCKIKDKQLQLEFHGTTTEP